MKQPTKEQIQWFWEQCGWHRKGELYVLEIRCSDKVQGEIIGQKELPLIDLNNLFKYAVPELSRRGLRIRLINQPVGRDTFFCAIGGKYLAHEWAEERTLELALFWAVYKAFGGEK